MRVLHVFKDYYPPTRGGIEQHVNDVVHSLDGFEFEVLTAARSRSGVVEDDEGVRVIRAAEYGRISTSPVTPGWAGAFRDVPADLVHFHMPNPFGEGTFLASRARRPLVATYHADVVGRRALRPGFFPVREAFLRRASRIVVTSPPMAEASALARHRDRVVTIPFGVELERWRRRPARADEIRDRYPGRLVLFLGRLRRYKGLDVFFDAMRMVDGTLLVVGDGPERAKLTDAAQRASSARVVFVGEVADDDRAAYYHAADVFALPSVSRAEAFGIAMLEAMACGTPVVSTDLGTGTSFVNVAGETGLVVPRRSHEALADAINALLADEARRRAMGEAAKRRVQERFTKKAMLEALRALYTSL